MGTVGGIGSPSAGQNVSNPLVENFVLADAATEYAINLRDGTKRFSVAARGVAKLQLSYTENESDDIFKTILPGNEYEQDRLSGAPITLYLQSSHANITIEVETWV